MKHRILATLSLWGLVIGLTYFLGDWGAFILIGAFAMGSFYELLDLMHRAGRPVDHVVSLVAFPLLLLACILIPPTVLPPFVILGIIFTGIMIACLLNSDVGTFSATVAPTVGSVFMLGIPFCAAILLVHDFGLVPLIWVIAVTKFGDVGALLTGMWLGKHRMAPAHSPNKTWEGLGGGVLLSILVGMGFVLWFGRWMPDSITVLVAGVMSLFITLSGVLSDLLESALKREARVKDSGNLIPGIGGILDLTDSALLAFPVGYALIWLAA